MKSIKQKIAEIQNEIGVLKKDTKGYNYKYATLSQVQERLNPLLTQHKLLLTQPIVSNDGKNVLITNIEELDGEGKIGSNMILPDLQDPQKLGSAISYFRRYSIVSLFALQQEDDDGAKASGKYPDIK